MEALAHFLSVRDIARLRQTCARIRACLDDGAMNREISRRFPEYGGVRFDNDNPQRMLALIEDRANTKGVCRDRIWIVDDCENQPPLARHEFMLRGDIIRDERVYTWSYWNGYCIIPSEYPRIPSCFDVPRDFPPEYFASRTFAYIFTINVARYRAQLLATLTPNINHGSHATFVEHGRTYTCVFNLHKARVVNAHLINDEQFRATYDGGGVFAIPLFGDWC